MDIARIKEIFAISNSEKIHEVLPPTPGTDFGQKAREI
jgi:hypothetical protein